MWKSTRNDFYKARAVRNTCSKGNIYRSQGALAATDKIYLYRLGNWQRLTDNGLTMQLVVSCLCPIAEEGALRVNINSRSRIQMRDLLSEKSTRPWTKGELCESF